MSMLPYGVSIWLFLIGLYGVATSRHLIHLIVCLSVAQSSTYILLLAIGYRHGAGPPIFLRAPVGTPAVDPVVQAPGADGRRRQRRRDRIVAGRRDPHP